MGDQTEALAPWNGWPPAEHEKVEHHWLKHPNGNVHAVGWLPGASLWINPLKGGDHLLDPWRMARAGWLWLAPNRLEDAQQRATLLDALKVITEHYAEFIDSGDALGDLVRHTDIPAIAQAVAAIAKAEGRA